MAITKPYMDLYVLFFTEIMLKKPLFCSAPPPPHQKNSEKQFIFLGSR